MRDHKFSLSNFITPEVFLVFYIFFAFVGLSPFSIGVDELNPAEADASSFRRMFYIGFFAFSVYFFVKSKLDFLSAFRVCWPYLTFGAFILMSTLWSVEPDVTFVRATLYLISVFTLVFLIYSINVSDFFRKLTFLFAVLLILSFVSVFVLPTAMHSVGELAGNWRGIYSHKNDAGLAMVFSIILFICAYVKTHRKHWLFLSFIAFVFLYFTGSKTSIGFLFAGLSVGFMYSFYSSSVYFRSNYYLVLALFILMLSFWYVFSSYQILDLIYALLLDPDRFTGRALIWDYLLNLILDRPLLGYGYGAVWGLGEDSRLYDYAYGNVYWVFRLTQGHNSYLDLILAIGIIGLAFFVLLYVVKHLIFIGENAYLDKYFLFVFYGVWSFFLLHGLMESNFLLVDKGRWVVFHVLIFIKARLLYDAQCRN